MSSFSRFQELNRMRCISNGKTNSEFIFNGYPSTKIFDLNGRCRTAAVVNQQEKDSAYIYTKCNEPLDIGSVWQTESLHFLISEEIVVIKKVEWRKYVAILCNIEIGDGWGYFKGPEKSYINVELNQNVLLQSQQKPILIVPDGVLKFEDKVVIKDRAWLVQEYDNISTPGIAYCSLRATTADKTVAEEHKLNESYIEEKIEKVAQTTDDYVDPEDEHIIYVNATTENTINTESGYFKTSRSEIVVKKKTSKEVVFILPFGVDETEIQVKEDGEIVTYTYRLMVE